MTAAALTAIFLADGRSQLPVALLYIVPTGLTFWASDRWLPMATACAGALLAVSGIWTGAPKPVPLEYLAATRWLGAVILLGAGWLATQHRRVLDEASRRENMLRTVFDSDPACVKVLGADCVLQDMNRAGLAMIEADSLQPMLGRSVLPLVAERHRDAFEQLCRRTFQGESGSLQFEIVGLKGTRRWLETQSAPLLDAAGHVSAIVGVTTDISDRKRAEQHIRDSEQRLSQAAAIAGLGYFEHDHLDSALYWSPGARAIFGVEPGEECSHETVVQRTHPADRARAAATVRAAHDPRGGGTMTLASRIVRPNGDVRYVSIKSQTDFDERGRPTRTVGTLFDVTERTRAEMQRDRLARRVLEVQEEERRAMARDLHDDIGQALSALKLNLLRLRREGSGGARVISDSLRVVDEVVGQVRGLAMSLRPSVLDDLGLGAAVQWHAERAASRAGLSLRCDIASDLGSMAPAAEIACFRILQEALTNVHKHSGATEVRVRLHHVGDEVELLVEDNGQGFEPSAVGAANDRDVRMGLPSIEERAVLLGGTATITSATGEGCRVRVRFPLHATVSTPARRLRGVRGDGGPVPEPAGYFASRPPVTPSS